MTDRTTSPTQAALADLALAGFLACDSAESVPHASSEGFYGGSYQLSARPDRFITATLNLRNDKSDGDRATVNGAPYDVAGA